ncbi:acylglycerol lipase, partial [Sarracenia purpurea var. burkii]
LRFPPTLPSSSAGGAFTSRPFRFNTRDTDDIFADFSVDLVVLQRVRVLIRSNPYCYKGRPRLKTGNELLMASLDLEHRLHEVSFPFLVIHGDDDKVVDSSVSELLYNSASSADKSFKLYPGMWHSLTYGELPGNINVVFSDIIGWLNDRVAAKAVKVERKLKLQSTDGLLKVDSSKESSIVMPKSL